MSTRSVRVSIRKRIRWGEISLFKGIKEIVMEKHIYSIGPICTNDISHCYDVRYGVLEQYMGKKFSRLDVQTTQHSERGA